LRDRAKKSDDRDRARREMLAEWIEARDHAAPPDADALRSVPGSYEGDRSITVENGRLMFRRNLGMPEELVPLGSNRFALGGEARLTFAAGSPSPSVAVERADGTKSSYPRIVTGD